MNINIIKEHLNALEDNHKYIKILNRSIQPSTASNDPLYDRILLSYTDYVIKNIKQNIERQDDIANDLKLFLARNWDLVKGNLLCYTALPNHGLTQLLCDVAEYVAEQQSIESNKVSAIEILMPRIVCDSLLDPHPDLNQDDLRTVIQTHILGENYAYLVPVSLLTSGIDQLREDRQINPYFDVCDPRHNHNPQFEYLSDHDLKHLSHRSLTTQAIWDGVNQYKTLKNNKDTLLGQLNKLVRELGYNSVHGIGQECRQGSAF